MEQIINVKNSVLAAVTDAKRYIGARKEADELAAKYSLMVADMPMAIQAMDQYPEVRMAIRSKWKWIDTISCEYHGVRQGNCSYEVWHSVGSLSSASGLENAFFGIRDYYGLMPISENEWVDVKNGNYNGQSIARVHLNDVKKGDVPAAGIPYTVFVRLNKDACEISNSGELDYNAFMRDDRVLMVAGSPENRESLAKMLFGSIKDGGEGRSSVGSYHRITESGSNVGAMQSIQLITQADNNYRRGKEDTDLYCTARGRPVYLGIDLCGLIGCYPICGRFVVL